MNNKTLSAIFTAVGRRCGYDEAVAEFSPFNDFKVRWVRSYRWISFEISDYMEDAPEDIMESMATTIYLKMKGESGLPYSDEVCEWLTSDHFVRTKQPVFVRRYRGLGGLVGRKRDLSESYDRLVDMGLVEKDPDIYIGWESSRSQRVGRASVLMKVVAISQTLDDPKVPEKVLDYCLYSQLAHVGMGFCPSQSRRGPEYDALLSKFPDRAGAESYLRGMSLYVRGVSPVR